MRKWHYSLIPVIVLTASALNPTRAQELSPQTNFQKALLTFDIVINNPANLPRSILRVGVKSNLRYGHFQCRSGSGPLVPVANYIVRFHVGSKETIMDADPPIRIEPKDAVRFKVSLVPSAVGACGPWGAEVSAIVVFDNGAKIYSKPELLTASDVENYEQRTPKDEELLAALRHKDPEIRLVAVKKLSESTIEKDTIKILLEAKIDDPVMAVRLKAAEVIGEMGFKSLAGKLASQLNGSGSWAGAVYCEALARLRNPVAIDALISHLTNLKEKYPPYEATAALIYLEHPDVPAKVRTFLLAHTNWSSAGASEKQVELYVELCRILIHYRDTGSIPLISRLITGSRLDSRLINELFRLTDEDKLVQDPFLLSMRPALMAALKSDHAVARVSAISLLCRMPTENKVLEKIIGDGLSDPVKGVRINAAMCAADLGYRSFIDKIVSLKKSSDDAAEAAEYCKALAKLKAPCN